MGCMVYLCATRLACVYRETRRLLSKGFGILLYIEVQTMWTSPKFVNIARMCGGTAYLPVDATSSSVRISILNED